jgi:glycine/D-amino acid oxidase-like deaminating enzyme
VEWVVRALGLWKEFDQRWDIPLYHKTGLLWMFVGEDDYAKLSIPVIEEFGLKVDQLSNGDAKERYPQVNFDDVQSIYIEQEAGYLKAREACRVVCQKFQEAGGTYQQLAVKPGFNDRGEIEHLNLSNGEKLVADEYVFACGPWLPELFPDVIGSGISISRQEVYYFGTPAGVESFDAGKFPAWLNFDEPLHYGVPAVDRRGFKICNDSRGESMHPTHDSRVPSGEGIEKARQFLGHRFPQLKDAPLVESRVCQYSNSPDGHLVIDRHPLSANLWIIGGGSGHSFKLGPALGEHAASCVLGATSPHSTFSLARLADTSQQGSQHSTSWLDAEM